MKTFAGLGVTPHQPEPAASHRVFAVDPGGERTEATQDDIEYLRNKFKITDFSNIDVVPPKSQIEAINSKLKRMGYHDPEKILAQVFTSEGGGMFMDSGYFGIEIPKDAVTENVLVVMGGATRSINISNQRLPASWYTTLPDNYPLKKNATLFIKKFDDLLGEPSKVGAISSTASTDSAKVADFYDSTPLPDSNYSKFEAQHL